MRSFWKSLVVRMSEHSTFISFFPCGVSCDMSALYRFEYEAQMQTKELLEEAKKLEVKR